MGLYRFGPPDIFRVNAPLLKPRFLPAHLHGAPTDPQGPPTLTAGYTPASDPLSGLLPTGGRGSFTWAPAPAPAGHLPRCPSSCIWFPGGAGGRSPTPPQHTPAALAPPFFPSPPPSLPLSGRLLVTLSCSSLSCPSGAPTPPESVQS